MTIAVGFCFEGGILLGADSQYETYTMRTYGAKMGFFESGKSVVAFALAGHSRFAWSAINKCQEKLGGPIQKQHLASEIETILENEYRRNVLTHPAATTDPTIHYNCLIAICIPGKSISLYSTHETAMNPVAEYECIGIGESLAQFLIGPSRTIKRFSDEDALTLAAQVLDATKIHVPGCGGHSMVLVLRTDGTVDFMAAPAVEHLEKHLKSFDDEVRKLALSFGEFSRRGEFDGDLQRFNENVRASLHDWEKAATPENLKRTFLRVRDPNSTKPTDPRDPGSTTTDL
jgi:hypothetical protein